MVIRKREELMFGSTKIVVTTLAAALLVAVMLLVAVSAQAAGQAGARGGAAQTGPAAGDQKTAPLKVTKREYDKKVLLSAPALTESEQIGRAIFQQRCAYCHDGVGQPTYKTMGDWIGGEAVQGLGEETMKTFINTGTVRMPGFKYALDSKQMDDLIAFIKTIPSSEKPTQSQLDGKAAGLDGSD
jgi:mono/diheme cytochrome c family protein